MKEKAFTLAEVLITLGIIGVVAAMTLPTLVNKYQEKVLLTQVKQTYSDLENAVKLYVAQNGCSDITCISDTAGTSEDLLKRLYPMFKGAVYCSSTKDNGVCQYTLIKGYKPTNNGQGQSIYSDSFRAPFFVSASGAAYQVMQYNECPRTTQEHATDDKGNWILDSDDNPVMTSVTSDVCAIIYFDANGVNKGPNQYGADVFQVRILANSKKLSPHVYLSDLLYSEEFKYTPHSVGTDIK